MTNPTAEPTAPARTEAPVLCLGEALVDIIIRDDQILSEHVGGSPLNVACGITQLGHPALIASWWGDDERGRAIEAHATKHTVGIVPGSDKADRTAIANAHLDAQGRATYDFELVWDVPELPRQPRWPTCTPVASPPPLSRVRPRYLPRSRGWRSTAR